MDKEIYMKEFELLGHELCEAVGSRQGCEPVLFVLRKSLELLRECIYQFEEHAAFSSWELEGCPDDLNAMEVLAVLQALSEAKLTRNKWEKRP